MLRTMPDVFFTYMYTHTHTHTRVNLLSEEIIRGKGSFLFISWLLPLSGPLILVNAHVFLSLTKRR